MRWSVGIEAEGDRVLEMDEIVELADAVAPLGGIASGIGSTRYGAQIVVEAASREEAVQRGRADFAAAAATAGLPAWPVVRADAVSEAEDAEPEDAGRRAGGRGLRRRGPRVIRLGSLAGYAFSGPRVLGGWTPPERPGVFAVLYKPEPASERYAVIYVGHADDLSSVGLPFRHRRAPCWVKRAGSKWAVHIAYLEVPGGNRPHREMITNELVAVYRPFCNEQQYDNAWRDEWIGEYSDAPNTAPLPPPP